MSDWTDYCDGLDFGPLVPDAFARYRPAVIEGLAYFLQSLPEAWTFAMLAEQAGLDADAPVAERLVAIAHHCPALHKLGQVMARDRRLPPDFRALLQRLEVIPAAQDAQTMREIIETDIGPLDRLGITIDEPPLAEASVAVVVPFRWSETGGGDRHGVFKVLKDGIEERLDVELAALQAVGALLDERCHDLGLPHIDYEETFLQVRTLLAQEVHLSAEQRHLAAAGTLYAGMPQVAIPQVFPFSTPRITAMERLFGRKVTEAAALPASARRLLADVAVDALLARPIWSAADDSPFHADPHAGNLMVTDDGRLGILDWSLVGQLSKREREGLTQILLGAVTIDAGRIAQAIAGLADGVNTIALRTVIDAHLERLWRERLPSLPWLTSLMDDALTKAKARFGGGLVLFRKVLQTLSGVIADVSEDANADRVLAAVFVRQLLLEWSSRWWAGPFARSFATHLSNVELAHALMSLPLAATRQWLAAQGDLFRTLGGDREP